VAIPSRFTRGAVAVTLVSLCALAPGAALGDDEPKVDIKTFSVPGSDTPKVVATATLDQPAKKVWAIVSDCSKYKGRMPRIAAAKLLKKEGNVHTCEVTIEMPTPFSNLTAVTEAVHEESDKGMKRSWKLVKGDYKVNTGSWEVKPLGENQSQVTYTVHAEPNTAIPAFIREAAQKKTLPDMFAAVRREAAKL
jgi:ribosome-associated toxin RatA of RatAB toxin-antitoxin module